jgi:hypothetical protein
VGDDIIAATFSEFGRRAGRNASLGTDHVEIALCLFLEMQLIPVYQAPTLTYPKLWLPTIKVKTVQHDYRGEQSQNWFWNKQSNSI